jgi:molecular chaperone DnaJ
MKVGPGTQSGQQIRLKQKGMSVLRSASRGDLYVQLAVETPAHLTKRQKELLEEFNAECESEAVKAKTHPECAGFFAKIRDMFTEKAK